MRIRHPFCRQLPLSFFVLIGLAAAATASDKVEWRADYDSARREASTKSLPLFLDFGTEDCVHCRRMHQTTFKDPAIIKLLNERFIPLKIDANREPKLAQSLRIQAYPTMILAGNDGKILGWIEGYMEVSRMVEQLQRATAVQTPDWMARDYQEASKAVGGGDYARAVTLLKNIVEDGKDRSVQTKAREVLQEIEMQAAGRLARAKQMDDRGQTLEALDLLTELLRKYAGTEAAADGGKMLTSLADKPDVRSRQRARRAQEVLAQAREDFKAERYLKCLDHCEVLSAAYHDLTEGKEGEQLAAEIKANPERMARVCEAMNDRLAAMYMTLAETFMKKGQNDQATAYLDKVVKLNPTGGTAVVAQAKLAQINNKTPTIPTNLQKP
jgi:thioredoxin-like negative regulator of GroEL